MTATQPSTYLAIDDIVFRSGTCSATPTTMTTIPLPTVIPANDLTCNFDQGTTCIWTNNQAYPFSINNPSSQLQQMMPNIDHTTQASRGRYVFVLHTDQDQVNIKYASLSAMDNGIPNFNGNICISFWYYMRSNGINTYFNVSVSNRVLSRFGDHGEKWNQLRFDAYESPSGNLITISAAAQFGKYIIFN